MNDVIKTSYALLFKRNGITTGQLNTYPKSMMEDWAERKPSLVFECEDIAETYESMEGRGVEFPQTPKEMPWGKFAIFLDLEGDWYGLRERAKSTPQRD